MDTTGDELAIPAGCVAECRACPHRTWSEEESLEQKAQFLRQTLLPWAHLIHPIATVHGSERWGYRSRTKLGCRWDELANRWQFGMEPRDQFIPIPKCPVHSPLIRGSLELFQHLPPPTRLPLRFYVQSGSQVVLIVKTAETLDTSWLEENSPSGSWPHTLEEAGLKGLWLHQHPAAGRRLFAKNGWHLLWGEPRSQDDCGLMVGPQAFQQLIPSLHEASIQAALEFLQPKPGDGVVDLYAGIGSTARQWLRHGAEVIAVEADGEACSLAALNAPGSIILRGLCSQRLPQIDQWANQRSHLFRQRLVYANPPRLGLEPDVTQWLTHHFRPERLAILSCSPGTLRRDLHTLAQHGYEVTALIPYDFFPQTRHIETLALVKRMNA